MAFPFSDDPAAAAGAGFAAIYAIARFIASVTPPHTWFGRAAGWILGRAAPPKP
jgi:hypothetical protein